MMIRKWLTTLLCLMLALALPMCAMADTQHTLQIIPGDDVASVEALKDLFDALALTVTTNDTAGALTVSLSGNDVLTIALSADENGLYAQSELLGTDVYFVSWDDSIDLLKKQVKDELSDEEYAQLEAWLNQAKQTILAMVSGNAASQTDVEASLQGAMAQFQDDPKMVEWLQSIIAKVQIEEGEYTADTHDAAAQKTSLSMTAEDLLPLFETNYVRNTLLQTLLSDSENKELSQEQLEQKTDELLQKTRQIMQDSGYTMLLEMFTDASAETLLSANMTMHMEMKDTDDHDDDDDEDHDDNDNDTDIVDMKLVYNRLTTAEGVSHKGDFVMDIQDDDDKEQAVMQLNLLSADGQTDGSFAILADENQITLQMHKEMQDNASVKTIALYSRDDAAAIVEPAASDRPLFTLRITSKDNEGSVLSNFSKENAVNLLKLSSDELNTWFTGLQSNAMVVLMNAMSALPQSTLQLFTGNTQE